MDGPNHKANFERGILNARNNLILIVKYLRSNSVEPNYKEYLEVYVPKLEGTQYYDEFKADLDAINKPKKEVKKKEEVKEKEPAKEQKEEVPHEEEKPANEITEEDFRALPAKEQKELIDNKLEEQEREKGDDSNPDKRVALYFS
jgi:hypothetical protein